MKIFMKSRLIFKLIFLLVLTTIYEVIITFDLRLKEIAHLKKELNY